MFLQQPNRRIEYDIRNYRYHRKEKLSNSAKLKIATGAVVGTAIPLMLTAKKQNTSIFNIDYNLKNMIKMGACSILGGVIAGIFADKEEHRKQKIHEGVFQFMNSTIPALLTASIVAVAEKFKPLNNIPTKIAGVMTGLVGGMFIAAGLSNRIIDPYDEIPDRKLSIKDAVANVDDALGIFVLAKIPGADKIPTEKILPAVYSLSGYRAGSSN